MAPPPPSPPKQKRFVFKIRPHACVAPKNLNFTYRSGSSAASRKKKKWCVCVCVCVSLVLGPWVCPWSLAPWSSVLWVLGSFRWDPSLLSPWLGLRTPRSYPQRPGGHAGVDAGFRQFGDSFLCTRTAFWVQLTEIAVGTAMKRTKFQQKRRRKGAKKLTPCLIHVVLFLRFCIQTQPLKFLNPDLESSFLT